MSTVIGKSPPKVPGRHTHRRPEPVGDPTHVAIRGVEWNVYDLVSSAMREGAAARVNYDGNDLEIMGTSGFHEQTKVIFGLFVHEVATACEVPNAAMSQTTWKRPEVSRGLEADQGYHFDPKKIALVNAMRREGSGRSTSPMTPTRTSPSRSISRLPWLIERRSTGA